MSYETFQYLNYLWMAIAVAVFFVLLKITAPYGRHTSSTWGPKISNRLGWIIMEAPVIISLLYFMDLNVSSPSNITWILAGLFIFHYINRTFIFPFRIHTKGKKMPVVIVGSAIFFNLVNGFFLGYYFGHFADYVYDDFFKLHFGIGLVLFIYGMYINWKYDHTLIHLRKPGETDYVIPEGGLFNYVSCPNLLGEIIEWAGFAILCWNLPAVSFFVWTFANLVPRAMSHHQWYQQKFANYPAGRKAVFPFIL